MLLKTRSSTSFACAILAVIILLATKLSAIRNKVLRKFGVYSFALISALLLLHATLNLGDLLVGSFGRDMTFTGRTEIWQRCLQVDINPLVGVGYYSFWLGDRPEKISEGFFYKLNEAHNGYIETYLNSGIIGVFLLGMVLAAGFKETIREVLAGMSYGAVRLAFAGNDDHS